MFYVKKRYRVSSLLKKIYFHLLYTAFGCESDEKIVLEF